MNYIKASIEDDQIKIQMYLNDEPTTWIMFDKAQTENMINVLKKKLKELKKSTKACSSKNPDNMCDECNCWKHTRAMCS